MTQIDPTWIVAALGVLGMIFGIYSYFKDPQVKSEKVDALMAQDIKWLREDVAQLRDNHVHSLQKSLEQTNQNVSNLTVQVATLSTIIDERIPKK